MSDAATPGGLDEATRREAAERLATVRGRIAGAAARAGRDPSSVTLVGVAKRQPLERVLAAIDAGVRVLGQSYIQEARDVRPRIESALAGGAGVGPGELRWHMVGRLQRNKAGLAARLFDVVESVDRPELVDTLARRAEAEGRRLDVLIQVSLCGEPQKGGCEPDAVAALAARIAAAEALRFTGLMTVPAASADPEAARPAFRRLRALRDALAPADDCARRDGGAQDGDAPLALSMGMSGDLEVAIEEGATLVRVGTALFGEREAPPGR